MGSKYMTLEEKSIIIALHNKGLNTVQIGNSINRHQTTIERFLKKNNFKMNYGSRITDEEKSDIKNMYLNGMTCREIFAEYKHLYNCEEAIQRIIKKMGISRGSIKNM